MQRMAMAIAVVTATAACVPVEACSLPNRPASLESPGIRLGGHWLDRILLHEDTGLGSVTQISRRPGTGELALVGTRSALFLRAGDGPSRRLAFGQPGGHLELVDWPGGGLRYLDRGGGGWQLGALIGEDGARLWQPETGFGMNDMAAGDLDGDTVPEFAVAYNGRGGVRLLDAAGKELWRREDANVWHIEIVDTDGDGKREIVHSNAAGELTLRNASGNVVRRARTEGYFSQFSLLDWPAGRLGLLHAGDGTTRVVDFDGQVRRNLQTADTSLLAQASGARAHLGEGDHLVLSVSQSNWDRTQLFVFDPSGALRYHEVIAGMCPAVAAPDAGSFLFGCGARVYRYVPRS